MWPKDIRPHALQYNAPVVSSLSQWMESQAYSESSNHTRCFPFSICWSQAESRVGSNWTTLNVKNSTKEQEGDWSTRSRCNVITEHKKSEPFPIQKETCFAVQEHSLIVGDCNPLLNHATEQEDKLHTWDLWKQRVCFRERMWGSAMATSYNQPYELGSDPQFRQVWISGRLLN